MRAGRCVTPSPAARLRGFFFVQFMAVGMINAFGGIWFASRGLSETQIGVIGSATILAMLVVVLLSGRMADRASDWRQAIVLVMGAAGLIPILLIWVDGFWPILIVWVAAATAQSIAVPVVDAAGIRIARREGLDFGALRGLSTAGYLLIILVAGLLLSGLGLTLFLPLFIGFGLLRFVFAIALPPLRDQMQTQRTTSALTGRFAPWFFLPLLGWAFVDVNHIVLNSFQGLLWSQAGLGTSLIGALIALGAFAEAVMFFRFRAIARRFAPLTLLILAGLAAALRWIGLAVTVDPVFLIGLQIMHAFSYAMGFLAITNFIADRTSSDNAAEAQSFLLFLELLIRAPALVAFGWIAGEVGSLAYLGCLVLTLAGLACLVLARRNALPVVA